MNHKNIFRGPIAVLLVLLVSSFTIESPVKRFSPEGTWEYSVPGVQAGYEKGSMVIAEDGKDYKVTMVLNEYYKTDAEKVVYKKKTISFSIWVETEEIMVSGTFDSDEFKGSINYSEGDFKITATRKAK